MKKLILFFCLTITSTILFGQPGTETFLDSSISYSWNSVTKDWVFDELNTKVYDASGNLAEDLLSSWDSVSAAWNYKYGNRYSYDENGKRIEKVLIVWDEGLKDWKYPEYMGGDRPKPVYL